MQKKFIVLTVILIILLVLVFVFFQTKETTEPIFEETQARTSKGYKITDDFILINLPASIEAGIGFDENANE